MAKDSNGRRGELLDLNRLPARLIQDSLRDPATGIQGASPNLGRILPPHIYTVQGRAGTMARVYRNADEAMRDSITNAHRMRNECGVMECLQARQRGTCLLKWHLEPEDNKDQKQEKLCQELTTIIERIPRFMEMRRNLMEAIWYGKYGVVYQWDHRQIGGHIRHAIVHWEPRHGDKLVFRYDDGTGKYDPRQVGIRIGAGYELSKIRAMYPDYQRDKISPTDQGLAYFLDKWERETLMAIHKHEIEDGPWEDPYASGAIHGMGIRSRIYWSWYQSQELLSYLLEYTERASLGVEIWPYEFGNPDSYDKTREAAEERIGGGRSIVLMPVYRGEDAQMMTIQHIEPGLGGLESLKSVIEDYFGKRIKRYILGQVLTSEAEATGLGSGVADAHLATYADIVRYDSTNLEETLTTDLVRPLQLLNFPSMRNVFVRFRIDTESDQAEKIMAGYEQGWQMGLKIKAEDVYQLIGATAPDDDDEVLQNPQFMQAQAMMQAPGGGAPTGALPNGMPGAGGPAGPPPEPGMSWVDPSPTHAGYWRHPPSTKPVFPGIGQPQQYQLAGRPERYEQPGSGASKPQPNVWPGNPAAGQPTGGLRIGAMDGSGEVSPEHMMPVDPDFEQKHPRGGPKNPGQFAPKPGGPDEKSDQKPEQPQEQTPEQPAPGAAAGAQEAPAGGQGPQTPAPGSLPQGQAAPPPPRYNPIGQLMQLPLLKGAQLQRLDDGSAEIHAANGQVLRVRTGSPEELEAAVAQNPQAWQRSQAVQAGEIPAGMYSNGEITIRDDATPDEMSHELIHAMVDMGLITPAEVARFGGEEDLAYSYQNWVRQQKPESGHGIFEKAWDFMAQALGSPEAAQRGVMRSIDRGRLSEMVRLPKTSPDPHTMDENNPMSAVSPDGGLSAATVMFATRGAEKWLKKFQRDPRILKTFGKDEIDRFVEGTRLTHAMFGDFSLIPEETKDNPIRDNTDPLFKYTIDASTVCPTQDGYVAVINTLQRAYNRIFNKTERHMIGQMMFDVGATPACWYCYGQASRDNAANLVINANDVWNQVRSAKASGEYDKLYNAYARLANRTHPASTRPLSAAETKKLKALKKQLKAHWQPKSPTSSPWAFENRADSKKYDAHLAQRDALQAKADALKAERRKLDPKDRKKLKALNDWLKASKKGKGSTLSDYIDQWGNDPNAEALWNDLPRVHDLLMGYTPPRNELEQHTKDAMQAIASVAQVNKPKTWAEYKQQFMSMTEQDVSSANAAAGFRMNSQTDFRPWHMLETSQVLAHMKAKGAMAHAYTREPAFIECFGDTGLKFNMSVGYARDDQGQIIYEADGTPMFDMMGMKKEDALHYRQKHPQNCGTMLVALNHDMVMAGLEDDNIDMMIPYHAGSVPEGVDYYQGAQDFTKFQHEDWSGFSQRFGKNGKATIVTKDGRQITVKSHQPLTREHHGDDKETYLDLCDQLGIVPRFPQYCGRTHQIADPTIRQAAMAMAGGGVDHDNYMKMVKDVAREPMKHDVVDPSKINWEAASTTVDNYIRAGGYEKDPTVSGPRFDAVVSLMREKIDDGTLKRMADAPNQIGPQQLVGVGSFIGGGGGSRPLGGQQPLAMGSQAGGGSIPMKAAAGAPTLSQSRHAMLGQAEHYGTHRTITTDGRGGEDPFVHLLDEDPETYDATSAPAIGRDQFAYQDAPRDQDMCSNCYFYNEPHCTLFGELSADPDLPFNLDTQVQSTSWCMLHTANDGQQGKYARATRFAKAEADRYAKQLNIFGEWEESKHPRDSGGQFTHVPAKQQQFWSGLELGPGQRDFLDEQPDLAAETHPKTPEGSAKVDRDRTPHVEGIDQRRPLPIDQPAEPVQKTMKVLSVDQAPELARPGDSYLYVTRAADGWELRIAFYGMMVLLPGQQPRSSSLAKLGSDYDRAIARATKVAEDRGHHTLYTNLPATEPAPKKSGQEEVAEIDKQIKTLRRQIAATKRKLAASKKRQEGVETKDDEDDDSDQYSRPRFRYRVYEVVR